MKTKIEKMNAGTYRKDRERDAVFRSTIKNTLHRTYRKDRERDPVTTEALTSIPDPEMDLPQAASHYYKSVCSTLISRGSLTAGDIPAIIRAAMIQQQFFESSNDCMKHGYYQVTATGYSAKNAYLQTMIDCEKSLAAFEKAYGLNLASRSKMTFPAKKEPNPFDEI